MNKILFAMAAAGLALLGIVRALSIDNQLTIVKHDCYERIAIGQRLNAKDVYKSFNYTTLDECRLACTQQRNACKAFSFGISSKGNNATCELSLTPIKETPDLKPIGTILETDFDLYIKKLGCSLVVDDKNHNDDNKPDTLGNIKPDQTTVKHESEKVQTLVSVASGPNSYLHPIHDILVSNSKDYGNLPPFRPDALNQPYDDRQSLKPRPDRKPYGSNSYYDEYQRPSYGNFHQEKPISDGYDKPLKPISDGYGGFNDDRRKPFDPPNSSGYGGYNNPKPINDAYDSFNDNRYKPTNQGYGGFNDPKPVNNFNDDRHKPENGYQDTGFNNPKPVNDGYGNFNDDRRKPLKPNDFHNHKPINDGYGSFNDDRRKPGAYPDPGYGGFNDPKPRPTKPNHYDNRPDHYDYYYHYCDKPDHFHDNFRPNWDRYDEVKPVRPNDRFSGYLRPIPNRYGSVIPHPDEYTRKPDDGDGYNKPPKRPNFNKEEIKPEGISEKPGEDDNKNNNTPGKLMVTHSVGYHGQKITSIITELNDGKTVCCVFDAFTTSDKIVHKF